VKRTNVATKSPRRRQEEKNEDTKHKEMPRVFKATMKPKPSNHSSQGKIIDSDESYFEEESTSFDAADFFVEIKDLPDMNIPKVAPHRKPSEEDSIQQCGKVMDRHSNSSLTSLMSDLSDGSMEGDLDDSSLKSFGEEEKDVVFDGSPVRRSPRLSTSRSRLLSRSGSSRSLLNRSGSSRSLLNRSGSRV